MPYSKTDYPASLKNLMAPVRNKAVEIINALLAGGNEEGKAIAIGTAQAEKWANERGQRIRKKGK